MGTLKQCSRDPPFLCKRTLPKLNMDEPESIKSRDGLGFAQFCDNISTDSERRSNVKYIFNIKVKFIIVN